MTAYELARLAVSTRTEQTQTMALQALQELGLQDYVVAIDFDGTLCQSGSTRDRRAEPLIIEHAKMLQRYHIGTILWTCREGQLLDDAVAWCTERGLNFDAINKTRQAASRNGELTRARSVLMSTGMIWRCE